MVRDVVKIKRKYVFLEGDMVFINLSKRDKIKLKGLLRSTKGSKLLWSAGWPDNYWLYGYDKKGRIINSISDECFKSALDRETIVLMELLQREASFKWKEIVAGVISDLQEGKSDRFGLYTLYKSLC